MVGVMGTAKMQFGGKTWPVFYYATQVGRNSAIAAAGVQSWIQFKYWDSEAQTSDSYYNLSTFFTCLNAVNCSAAYTVSCGSKDLLTGKSSATLNKANTCAQVGDFNGNNSYSVPGYASTDE